MSEGLSGSLGTEKIFDMEAVVDAPKKLRVGFLSPAFKITSENPGAEAHPQQWYLALEVLTGLHSFWKKYFGWF